MMYVYSQSILRNFQLYFQCNLLSLNMLKALLFDAHSNLVKYLEECEHVEIFELKTFILLTILPVLCNNIKCEIKIQIRWHSRLGKGELPFGQANLYTQTTEGRWNHGNIMTKHLMKLSPLLNSIGTLFLPWCFSFILLHLVGPSLVQWHMRASSSVFHEPFVWTNFKSFII